MKSIIQKDRDRCFLCGRRGTSSDPLDEHHVIFGPFRKIAERYGLKVYLHHFSCHEFGLDYYIKESLRAEMEAGK